MVTIHSALQLMGHLVSQYVVTVRGLSLVDDTDSSESSVKSVYDNGLTVLVNRINTNRFLVNFLSADIDGDSESLQLDLAQLEAIDLVYPLDSNKIPPIVVANLNRIVDSKLQISFFKKMVSEQKSPQQNSAAPPPLPPLPPSIGTQTGTEEEFKRPSDMPDFDDEYEIKSKPNAGSLRDAPVPSIGDRDLYPGGEKYPTIKPYIDPYSAIGEGGMYPTPHHPLFGGPSGVGSSSRLGVPPGARFDDPYSEDNLDDVGRGLPGNLRRGPPPPGGFNPFPPQGGFNPFGGNGGFGGFM